MRGLISPGQNLTGEQSHSCLASNRGVNISTIQKKNRFKRFTKNSKEHLTATIYALRNPNYFITVTYGGFYPSSQIEIRKECRRLISHLRKLKCYGIWKIEFQDRTAVHFHLVINSPVDEKQLAASLDRFIQYRSDHYSEGSFKTEPIYYLPRLCRYLTCQKRSASPPPDWHGRFWAEFRLTPPRPPVPPRQVAEEDEPGIPLEPLEDDDHPDHLEDKNGTVDP